MTVMQNVITPIIQLLVYFFIFGFIFFVVGRAVFISWNKTWKWVFKYKLKRKAYPKDDSELVVETLKTGTNRDLFRMNMLSAGLSNDRTNELCFIFDEHKRKGGIKNGYEKEENK